MNPDELTYIEQILKTQIQSSAQVRGSVSDKNKIFVITTTDQSYILKTIPTQQDIGEEDLFDVIYDCKIHEFANKHIPTQQPYRKVFYLDQSRNNVFSKNFIILSFLPGITAYESDEKDVILDHVWEQLKNLYKNSPIVKLPSLIGETYLNFDRDSSDYLHFASMYSVRHELNYTNKVSVFFKNDISTFAPTLYKEQLLELAEDTSSFSNKNFVAIHADIKLGNVLVDSTNDINIIDWSRGHFGDPLIDFSDILINYYAYTNRNLNNLIDTEYSHLNMYSRDFDEYLARLTYYIKYKLYSIARVFFPDRLADMCAFITKKTSLADLITEHTWLKGIHY